MESGESLNVSYIPLHFYHKSIATLNPNARLSTNLFLFGCLDKSRRLRNRYVSERGFYSFMVTSRCPVD